MNDYSQERPPEQFNANQNVLITQLVTVTRLKYIWICVDVNSKASSADHRLRKG